MAVSWFRATELGPCPPKCSKASYGVRFCLTVPRPLSRRAKKRKPRGIRSSSNRAALTLVGSPLSFLSGSNPANPSKTWSSRYDGKGDGGICKIVQVAVLLGLSEKHGGASEVPTVHVALYRSPKLLITLFLG